MKLVYLSLLLTLCFTGNHSQSIGTVSDGQLIDGVKIPLKGENYFYFDDLSYQMDRAYLNDKVLNTLLDGYQLMKDQYPERTFGIMEGSNKNGGPIPPHQTHQNGTSVDFMTPLLAHEKPFTELDHIGASHYLLEFNDDGTYSKNKEVLIDFDCIAAHILALQEAGKQYGTYVKKVIFKIELKDELFASPNGQKLKESGIYFAQKLTQKVNEVHDDHYHVDFGFTNE